MRRPVSYLCDRGAHNVCQRNGGYVNTTPREACACACHVKAERPIVACKHADGDARPYIDVYGDE